MKGKKQYQEKLFVNFQLSDRVPEDNFYRRLKKIVDFDFPHKSGLALKALEENNITGYIPNKAQFIYERPGFIYNDDVDYYTCPGNKELTYRHL